ncbi:replication endonuclease [Bermanella marisrubri]|uniref:Putative replication protein n=1 Tax=Bermanella marisrubri TaxID=207949 RepID=Q1N4Q7_9GAMM|nr:replication endonuclease [Bermanella marisrubri]EAT13371.1 Putative replication protein [Oceanobacter sp. RED65] [Bermanella marisrubri]QIZ84126.1 replication endonuclease [Bermanella marisrubri]
MVDFVRKELVKTVRPLALKAGCLRNTLIADWQRTVKTGGFNAASQANDRLRKTVNRMKFGSFGLGNTDRNDMKNYCDRMAKTFFEVVPKFPFHMSIDDAADVISSAAKLRAHGLEWKRPECDAEAEVSLYRLYNRLCSPSFWMNKLKRRQKRVIEEVARDYGLVNKYRGAYVSDLSLSLRQREARKNQKILENTLAVNDDGESYTLAELQALSISNPEIRRAELMSRVRGFELMAEQNQHIAVFWTVTCPSRFHSHSATNGQRNKKHNGETVRDAQNYLVSMWAAFRSWCDRNGIYFYGFRVAEPHHDGCPHWHVLVFGDSKDLQKATSELSARSLREDGAEHGANVNRFTAEWIRSGETKDGRKLSAAGYIAKYIAKSVDGFSVAGDSSIDENGNRFEMGQDSESGAARVVAWARSHGIRQFQQIGGAYVSVWREIRKLHGVCDDDEAAEIIEAVEEKMSVDAAVAWAVFNFLNGAGDGQRLKLWRDDLRPESHNLTFIENRLKENCSPLEFPIEQVEVSRFGQYGPSYLNGYGEVVSKIKGLVLDGSKKIVTRLREWVLLKKDEMKTLDFAASPRLDLCQ